MAHQRKTQILSRSTQRLSYLSDLFHSAHLICALNGNYNYLAFKLL